MTETMEIDLSSLADFMVGVDFSPPNEAPPAERPKAEEPKKRKRRTKAEIEAERKTGAETGPAMPANGATTSVSEATETLTFIEDTPVTGAPLSNPFTPELKDAGARLLGYQSDEQRTRILNGEKEDGGVTTAITNTFPMPPLKAPPEAPPDATDAQVLTDEIHFLRDDLRELGGEIRKLALAVDRFREDEDRRYKEDVAREAPKS